MQDFKKLLVWKKAHALVLNTYRAAGQIRGTLHLSLRSQMVRSAMSIPTNIVEGRAKRSEREFGRFLGYSLSSATELEYHLIVARDLGLMRESDVTSLLTQVIEVRRMTHGLLNRIASEPEPDPLVDSDSSRGTGRRRVTDRSVIW
jgi:four helix bundle protein